MDCTHLRWALVALAALTAACGEDATLQTTTTDGSTPPSTSGGNHAPTIGGTPQTSAVAGSNYSFTPTASDADNDSLVFSVSGLPAWATFAAQTGHVSGTAPTAAGTSAPIVISVSDGIASASLPAFTITVTVASTSPPPTTNTAPTITGTPPSAVLQDTQYTFAPTANDADGDALSYSVSGQPAWATFDPATGRLSGMPTAGDVGTTNGIVITVTDGQASASLGPFSIAVQAVATGSATLTWLPPTQNDDGSVLTDLAGFRVYWGTSQGNYPNSVTLDNPGLTTYVVENLVPGTYYFVTTALNASGVESGFSNVASKTIP